MAGQSEQNFAAVLQFFAGLSANRAAKRESRSLKKQGNLAAEEAEITAQRRTREGERFKARQALGFLKSGISLKGSPLLALAETETETRFQASAIRKAGGDPS